jgi:hypothetical protein
VRALGETRELGKATANIAEFANDAVTSESWQADPTLPSIQASMKFGQFLYAYLGDDLDWSFDRERFLDVYQDLEALLHEPGVISVTTRVELWNIRSEVPEIPLADGVEVRQLSAEEHERFVAEALDGERFGPLERFAHYGMEPPTPELYLELKRQFRDFLKSGEAPSYFALWEAGTDAMQATRWLIQGLRLVTPGDFGFGVYEVETTNQLLQGGGPTTFSVAREWRPRKPKKQNPQTSNWQRPQRRSFLGSAWESIWTITPTGPRVVLTADMAQELEKIWPLLQHETHEKLETAFQRFELSYDRTDPEDRIIDYWVALESLFLPDDDRELARSASQRLAFFIEETGSDRLEIYRNSKKSYGFRSVVVHGNAYDPAEVELSANLIEGYLRRALVKFLRTNSPLSQPDCVGLDHEMMLSSKDTAP